MLAIHPLLWFRFCLEKSEKRNENQFCFDVLNCRMCKSLWDGHGAKPKSCLYCAFRMFLRGLDRRCDHIFHRVFVDLRSSLAWNNVISDIQLVLGEFTSGASAPAEKDSCNIADESRDDMKLNTLTVLEAKLFLHSVWLVDSCRVVDEQVSISNITGMQVALTAQSVFHAWNAVMQEAGLGSFASSAHLFLSQNDPAGQLEVIEKRRNGFYPDCQLKGFFEKFTVWKKGDADSDEVSHKVKGWTRLFVGSVIWWWATCSSVKKWLAPSSSKRACSWMVSSETLTGS